MEINVSTQAAGVDPIQVTDVQVQNGGKPTLSCGYQLEFFRQSNLNCLLTPAGFSADAPGPTGPSP